MYQIKLNQNTHGIIGLSAVWPTSCFKKSDDIFIFNNSVKNEPIIVIFGM